ncbi:GNAT family N-acetyltransferase [Aetokthonos hydrillicola Thurmond2011]|jgi:predicted GNAT family N-acyltransferase|uniref:GNAT family N-acetyltransferase n=1 Tax=Aetokthonos hydrillicola Thurmond2011 TaxID=2712845 RepID=A0AAP5I5V5_9CYAN|nr:GNAT family N-acetyltransferase [Aetokthonos hydrillicola]MBO3461248.1 GNAT family N-acetyltransferase [Aetokthonos hydrillicola CCALA 1050]MBW4583706.1 GNAT family N-acetyltransferase [Aetokthonos hydrillicola CCALA 1050]MDR9895598.1 GNAT family N-acetyltransferase [Aetokthonos hydrillicola Thurmond2011]
MDNVVIKIATSPEELRAIRIIRESVFQKEQGVDPASDFDGLDEICQQLIACTSSEYIGTARIRYLNDKTAKIERLAVLPIARGHNIGKQIMEKALKIIADRDISQVELHAQEYIKSLHEKLGFQEQGEIFEEAGIRHVRMIKKLKNDDKEGTGNYGHGELPEN